MKIKGTASISPYGERTPETWACTGCGRKVTIQVPAAKPAYPHRTCRSTPKGSYRPTTEEET